MTERRGKDARTRKNCGLRNGRSTASRRISANNVQVDSFGWVPCYPHWQENADSQGKTHGVGGGKDGGEIKWLINIEHISVQN